MSLLLEHPVGEGKTAGVVVPVGQVLEELGDDASLLVAALVEDDVQELPEFDHARLVIVHQPHQFFNLLHRCHQS